ncbi:MAG: hypothetical protein JWQ63_2968, partial [Mucilaginibacter sp.]|nr:hypothetical protein [Mucilaginibacter sp.]
RMLVEQEYKKQIKTSNKVLSELKNEYNLSNEQ